MSARATQCTHGAQFAVMMSSHYPPIREPRILSHVVRGPTDTHRRSLTHLDRQPPTWDCLLIGSTNSCCGSICITTALVACKAHIYLRSWEPELREGAAVCIAEWITLPQRGPTGVATCSHACGWAKFRAGAVARSRLVLLTVSPVDHPPFPVLRNEWKRCQTRVPRGIDREEPPRRRGVDRRRCPEAERDPEGDCAHGVAAWYVLSTLACRHKATH